MKIFFRAVVVAVLVLLATPARGQEAVFPNFVIGGGYATSITFTNNTEIKTYLNLWFLAKDGGALPVVWNGREGEFGNMNPGLPVPGLGSLTLVFSSTSATPVVGWLWVVPTDGTAHQALGRLEYTGRTEYAPEGVLMGQAEAPASVSLKKFGFVATRQGGNETGVAIANPNPAAAGLSFVIRSEGGAVVASFTLPPIPAFGQVSGFTSELALAGGVALPVDWTGGRVEVAATVPVAATTLFFSNVAGTATFSSGKVFSLEK